MSEILKQETNKCVIPSLEGSGRRGKMRDSIVESEDAIMQPFSGKKSKGSALLGHNYHTTSKACETLTPIYFLYLP